MSGWELILAFGIMVFGCVGVFAFLLFGMYGSLDKWSRGD
jgi:hypothetical protein